LADSEDILERGEKPKTKKKKPKRNFSQDMFQSDVLLTEHKSFLWVKSFSNAYTALWINIDIKSDVSGVEKEAFSKPASAYQH
jgi:hypothetical protein